MTGHYQRYVDYRNKWRRMHADIAFILIIERLKYGDNRNCLAPPTLPSGRNILNKQERTSAIIKIAYNVASSTRLRRSQVNMV